MSASLAALLYEAWRDAADRVTPQLDPYVDKSISRWKRREPWASLSATERMVWEAVARTSRAQWAAEVRVGEPVASG